MKAFCNSMPKRFMISYKSPFRFAWDGVPILMALYKAVIMPLEVGFRLPYGYMQVDIYINIVMDVLFIIDNLMMFFTSF
jgi:hypothetical protein